MNKKPNQPGQLITFEGIDGAGKSTNIKFVSSMLENLHIKHIVTREPGGTKISEKIREILINPKNSKMDSMTELLLMFAARNQHIKEIIQPNLKKGYIVLCDRFMDASYAYQGGGRNIDNNILSMLEMFVAKNLKIDLTLYFDIDVETSILRTKHKNLDRFEIEGGEFMNRVRNAYIKRMSNNIHRFKLINSLLPVNEVKFNIKNIILNQIKDLI